MTARQLGAFVLRWSWLLLLGAVLPSVVSYRIASQLPDVYEGDTKILVGSTDATSGAGDYSAPQTPAQLTATYAQVITSRPVLEAAIQAGGLDLSDDAVAGMVSAAPIRDTQLILISVRAGDPRFAATFANLLAAAFVQRVESSQSSRYAAVEGALAVQVDQLDASQADLTRQLGDARLRPQTIERDNQVATLQFALLQVQQSYAAAQRSYQDVLLAKARSTNPIIVVEPATVPRAPGQSQVRQAVLSAAGVGLLVAIAIAYLFERLDQHLRSPDRVEPLTGLRSLGALPRVQAGRQHLEDPEVVGAFQLLSAKLLSALGNSPAKVVVVSSMTPGGGATTTALNIAVTMAQAGRLVILVDANLDQPGLSELLGADRQQGMTRMLMGARVPVAEHLVDTQVPRLRLLPAGPPAPGSAALLASERTHGYLADLVHIADVVIVDTSPVTGASSTLGLAASADGVVLVADAWRTQAREVVSAAIILRSSGANIIGVVLNRFSRTSGRLPYDKATQAHSTSDGVAKPVAGRLDQLSV